MSSFKIGFIGFGEVAAAFSRPMREKGVEVAAYDVLLSQEQGREVLQRRAHDQGIQFCALPEVLADADYVLSTVTTQAAEDAARACVAYLEPGQIYIDLNSVAPVQKMRIASLIQPSGADFVEGAILDAVGVAGASAHVLITGGRGEEVASTLTKLGLHASYYGAQIGKASTFKMLRSIFSKGLEALLIELLVAGRRAGIERDIWQDVVEFMMRNPFDQVASNWVQSHAVAHERRYHEIAQVMETLQEMGIEPIMTRGTRDFFKRSLSLGLKGAFPERPHSIGPVIEFMEEQLREK